MGPKLALGSLDRMNMLTPAATNTIQRPATALAAGPRGPTK